MNDFYKKIKCQKCNMDLIEEGQNIIKLSQNSEIYSYGESIHRLARIVGSDSRKRKIFKIQHIYISCKNCLHMTDSQHYAFNINDVKIHGVDGDMFEILEDNRMEKQNKIISNTNIQIVNISKKMEGTIDFTI